MSKLFSLLVLVVVCQTAFAQEFFNCGNVDWYNQHMANNPAIQHNEEQLELFTRDFVAQHPNGSRDNSDPDYIIPIVFHVLHDYGIENISDAQIIDAVRVLNNNFRKNNADTAFTVPAFQGIAADSKIEFRLARLDPNGNCTNGIERIATTQTYYGDDDSKINQWPNERYLNVWVVKEIQSGAAGYAIYPSAAQFNPSSDGIMILHNYVGSIGTGSPSRSTALTHEVGHYLNLQHVWGNSNNPGVSCGSDQVNDTPETKGWTSCNLSGNVCNPGIVENVQNFMEYAYCSTMYTNGQRNRMHAALNSNTADRNNLWSAGNLIATGTDDLNYADCSPKPVISPDDTRFVCVGDTVWFKHFTTNGSASSWDWTLPGSSPSSSTDSSAFAVYATPGTYDVILTTSNDAGSNGTTANDYVTVLPNTGIHQAVGFMENFEGFSFSGSNWAVVNPEGSAWTLSTSVGYSGTKSLKLNTLGQLTEMADHFITPTYDLTGLANPMLHFRVAYAQRETTDVDQLRVYASTDCGQTWTLRYSKVGVQLNTAAATVTNAFVPNATQWRQESVNLSLFAGNPNVRFRFEFTYKGGNNIYIDDINFDPTTNIDETENNLAMSVFPNPASGNELAMSFNLPEALSHATVKLVSAEGRVVELLQPSRLEVGHQLLHFNLSDVPSGYYLLWLRDGNSAWSRPVVVKH